MVFTKQCTVWFMVFNATFNNISVISWWSVLLVEETGKKQRPVARHWQTLSHNVVSIQTMQHSRNINYCTYICSLFLYNIIQFSLSMFYQIILDSCHKLPYLYKIKMSFLQDILEYQFVFNHSKMVTQNKKQTIN